MTRITKQQVAQVAALAGLELPAHRHQRLAGQLEQILDYVAQLQELDTEAVEPTCQVHPGAAPQRQDVARQGQGIALLNQAPAQQDHHFITRRQKKGGQVLPLDTYEGGQVLPLDTCGADSTARCQDGADGRGAPAFVNPEPGSPAAPGAVEQVDLVRRRKLGVEELTRAHLERISALDPSLGAFLSVDSDGALASARALDRALARGHDPGPLAGLPVAIKDSLLTQGLPTTCGSRTLEGWVPAQDAAAVARLRRAGAVILGKTNMDEFCMGSSSEHSAFFVCRNPGDPTRVAGGSSGGSAAALAARLCAAALGSDTGGSIRQPASFCGVVGLKPTYGLVSRRGLIAFASSLDQVGPMARSVEDCALLLELLVGHDPQDSTSLAVAPGAYRQACGRGVDGMRVGLPTDRLFHSAEPRARQAVRRAVEQLRLQGAVTVPVSLPHCHHGVAAYHLIATSEASSNLARYDGIRYGRRRRFGPEVQRRILLGTFALSAGYSGAFYQTAQKVRTLLRRDFDAAFASCDVIATPTTPGPAFALGERLDDPLQMYLSDVFTTSCNLAGLPGISVPCGSAAGLPLGLQLLSPPLEEQRLLAAAAAVERAGAR